MTARSGLNAQIGFVPEVTVGVPVTPTTFVPFLDESLGDDRGRIESDGIIAGARLIRSQQWAEGQSDVKGDIGLELYDRSIGALFLSMFGNVVTTGSNPYTHTFTPGELAGRSLTVQVGTPSTEAGAVIPRTYSGMQVASWEIGLEAGKFATLGLSLVGKYEIGYRQVTDAVLNSTTTVTSATAAFVPADEGKPISATGITAGTTIATVVNATTVTLSATATASATGVTLTMGVPLASASFAAGISPIPFRGATISIGGSVYRSTSIKLAGDNKLDDGRYAIGSAARDEALEEDLRAYTGTISSEFLNRTAYDRFVGGAEASLVLHMGKGASTVDITCNVRFDGKTPNVNGRKVVMQTLPFKCIGTTTDAAGITAVLVNADATP